MGDDQFSKLKGRSLVNKLNEHIIASLFLAGICVAGTVISVIGLIFSPAFILLIILFSFLTWKFFNHLKKVSETRKKLNRTLYVADDKSYIWDLESVRDKLMARMIQEGICPWNEGPCNSLNPCFCAKQKEYLKDLNLDTDKKQKITLNEYDAGT
jgi:hypothetical protein